MFKIECLLGVFDLPTSWENTRDGRILGMGEYLGWENTQVCTGSKQGKGAGFGFLYCVINREIVKSLCHEPDVCHFIVTTG